MSAIGLAESRARERLAGCTLSGTIDPVMGRGAILSATLFGRTRGLVLGVFYGHAGESFYLRQLARLTSPGSEGSRLTRCSGRSGSWPTQAR